MPENPIQPINWLTLNPLTQSPSFAQLLRARITPQKSSVILPGISSNQTEFQTFDIGDAGNSAIKAMDAFLGSLGVRTGDPETIHFSKHTGNIAIITKCRGNPQAGMMLNDAVENAIIFKELEYLLSVKHGYALRTLPEPLHIIGTFSGGIERLEKALHEQGIKFRNISGHEKAAILEKIPLEISLFALAGIMDDGPLFKRNANSVIEIEPESIPKLKACIEQVRALVRMAGPAKSMKS